MIKINKIKDVTCELYDPQNNLLGTIENEYELNDVRIQISEEKVEGYYVIFKEHKIPITSKGKINKWPPGFYDLQEIQFSKLFKLWSNDMKKPTDIGQN
jgi:hypothetical protein